jgi:hypothetical protein
VTVACGREAGARLVLNGPWDYESAARLADEALRQATWLHRLDPASVISRLPHDAADAEVRPDPWHPAAVLLHLPDQPGADPLGRATSLRDRAVARHLAEAAPELTRQSLTSNEGSAVALRLHRAEAEVTPLYGYVRMIPTPGPDTEFITEFRPRNSPRPAGP